jgi:2-hydroxychromene-2-carboxylate isomerase
MPAKPPLLYFSFRSPFSWLLVERLRRRAPDVWAALEPIPYWEPDERMASALARRGASIRYAQMSKAKHLYILQDTKRLSTRLGLEMRWPVDIAPWWEPSHLGWLAARRDGFQERYYDAIVTARWRHGADIASSQGVAAAATAAGLDGDALVAAAGSEEIREEGVACLQRAYEEDIFGVPYLKLGWQRFWGYDRLDAFLEAFDGARGRLPAATGVDEPPLVPAALVGSPHPYDTDTAGGCG